MDVVSVCALPVASLLWQRNTTWVLTLVCKGTFTMSPGEMTLAEEQEAPNEDDSYWNDDPARSVRSVSDLAPLKSKVDVLLVGGVFAPRGRPAMSLVARLAVGDLDKSIEVWGDRSFDASGTLVGPTPFARLPLTYERAGGGPMTWNPVGVARGARNRQGYVLLPNLQRPGQVVSGPEEVMTPVCFGPIAPSWPMRRDKLGALAQHGGWRGPLLSDDFDLDFFNAAPPDQQIANLRDDATLTVENLHPEHPVLTTSLPAVRPQATLEARNGARSIALKCDTVWIDTDRSICTLTWRGHLALSHAAEAGRIVVSLENRVASGRQTTLTMAKTITKAPSPGHRAGDAVSSTFVGSIELPASALPFTPVATPPATQEPQRPQPPDIGLPFPANPQASLAPSSITPPPPQEALSQTGPGWAPPPLRPIPRPEPSQVEPPPPPPMASSPIGSMVGFPPVPPPRPPALAHAGDAALVGLKAASDAAAPQQPAPRVVSVPAPPATAAEPPRHAATPENALEPNTLLQLVWYDPGAIPRIRRKPGFRNILTELDKRALDPEVDDPAFAAEPIDVEDRREVLELLARAEGVSSENVHQALLRGVREGSKFVALLDMFSGELSFPFDELAKLKATMTTVAPLVGNNDEALKNAVEAAKDFVAMPGLSSTSSVAEGLSKRLKDTYHATPRATPHGYVDTQVERALLEQRHYQKRFVLGNSHVRALFGQGANATPVYLTEALAQKLPMYQKLKARFIAEVHPRVDQFENQPAALKVVALGWVIPTPAANAPVQTPLQPPRPNNTTLGARIPSPK